MRNRPIGSSKRRSPPAATAEVAPQSRLDALVSLLTGMVVLCRLLTPTEGAAVGETLWIVQLAFFTLLVWLFARLRAGSIAWRLDRFDTAVCLIALGHFLSALLNHAETDRRASVNMVWEWCGVVVTWFLIRRIAERPCHRRSLLLAVSAAGASLAGLGVWQHYVGLDETRHEVQALQSEWDELQAAGRPLDPRSAAEWDRGVQRLRAKFVRFGIPADESSRMLWDQRLKSSSEPFGTFALANTFAGLLVTTLMLWVGILAEAILRREGRSRIVAVAVICALVAFCLVLTKSRTAYVGLFAGLAIGLFAHRSAAVSARQIWLWGGAAVAGLGCLALAATLTGGLDRLVVDEAFKSLRYRGEYWTGTWRMLTDGSMRLMFGVGPGNFRSFYTQYKLPASSEEIAEPHNLFLDVWAGGGLIALAGSGLLLGASLRPLWRRSDRASHEAESPWRDPVLIGAALSFGMVFLLEGSFDERMAPLLMGWTLATAAGLSLRRHDLSGSLYAAAGVALVVHLLGAGGIAMPAISQLLLLLTAAGGASMSSVARRGATTSSRAGLTCGAAALALYLGCWFSATTPVMNARNDVAAGDQALLDEGLADKAERAYRNAAEADPLDAEACDRLARLYLQSWQTKRAVDEELFDRAVDWQRQVIRRQPHNYGGYRALGNLFLIRFDRTRTPADAALAADEFARAVHLYPNHAELQSELAEALLSGGQPDAARSIAERALELDALNREGGHRDKLLSDARRNLMEGIAKPQLEIPE